MLILSSPRGGGAYGGVYDNLHLLVARGQTTERGVAFGDRPQAFGRRLLRWAALHEAYSGRDPQKLSAALAAGNLVVTASAMVMEPGAKPLINHVVLPQDRTVLRGELRTTENGLLVAGATDGRLHGIYFREARSQGYGPALLARGYVAYDRPDGIGSMQKLEGSAPRINELNGHTVGREPACFTPFVENINGLAAVERVAESVELLHGVDGQYVAVQVDVTPAHI